MNFAIAINKEKKKMLKIKEEIDNLLCMDYPPKEKVNEVCKKHLKMGEELEYLEMVFKNRVFQKFGLEYYQELEKIIANEKY